MEMKCRGCGATFDPQEEYCPYCGRENVRRRRQKAILARWQARYERERQQVLEASAGEIRIRKLTRFMWIMAGITALMFVISLSAYLAIDRLRLGSGPDPEYLQELKEQERWAAMQHYLYDADQGETRQEQYWLLAYLSEDVEELRFYRSEYLGLDKEQYRLALLDDASLDVYERDYMKNHFSFLVDRLLWSCSGILRLREEYTGDTWMAEMYGPLTGEGDRMLGEYEAEARASLKLLFGMDAEAAARLAEEYEPYGETEERYLEQVKEGWLRE